jgi:hypothetical protein
VAALAILGACGDDEDRHDHGNEVIGGGGHDKLGPHGGDLIELGDHVAHLEVVHDSEAGTLTLHVLDAGMKPTSLTTAPVLSLPTTAGPLQLVATVSGSGSSEWVFSDQTLKAEPDGARLRVVLGGVTYTPEVPHDQAGH